MEVTLKITYFVGAILIGLGIGFVHIGDGKTWHRSVGTGMITMGIILLGIGAGVL